MAGRTGAVSSPQPATVRRTRTNPIPSAILRVLDICAFPLFTIRYFKKKTPFRSKRCRLRIDRVNRRGLPLGQTAHDSAPNAWFFSLRLRAMDKSFIRPNPKILFLAPRRQDAKKSKFEKNLKPKTGPHARLSKENKIYTLIKPQTFSYFSF